MIILHVLNRFVVLCNSTPFAFYYLFFHYNSPNFNFFFWPPSCGGFYKIHVVCLSVRQFSIFLRNGSLVFSDFLHDGRSLEYLKTYCLKTEPFSPRIWTKMTPKWVFRVFWKMLTLVFLEIIWKENYCHCYFTTNPIAGKIQVLKLRAKILSGNQIAGFFKI